MNRVEFIFAAIDVLFHPLQNYKKIKGITHEKDISYNDNYDDTKMDYLYKPSHTPLPILINIHGGGFVKGDKKHRRSISEMYADKDWFVINMNYRLAPKHNFPDTITDVFTVLTMLPDIAKTYNLNLDKIVITGDSSGGYTSAMVVACLNDETLRKGLGLPECDITINGLIPFSALFDLVTVLNKRFPFRMTKVLGESITGIKLNKDFSNLKDYKYFDFISPINYVNNKWCPTLISYSKKDMFCAGQGEAFHDKLIEHGVKCDIVYSTSLIDNHCYHFNYWTKASKDTLKKVFEFLDEIKNK